MNSKLVLPILALFASFVIASGFEKVLQFQSADSLMIAAGHANYAISSRLFASQNWTTVSINGNHLLVVASDCTKLETTFDELSGEQRELLGSVMTPFEEGANKASDEASDKDPNFVASFSKDDYATQIVNRGEAYDYDYMGVPPNVYLVRKVSFKNYSIARGNLEERKGISRIVFVGRIFTIVHSDGSVRMQPISCAEGEDSLFLQELKLDQREGRLLEKARKFKGVLDELTKQAVELY